MADRKGVILYFDDWRPIVQLEDSKLALLLRAALNYAQGGEVPKISGELGVIWELIAAKIDLDGARFDKRVEDSAFAAYCREEKKAGRDPVSREAWKIERQTSVDICRYPSTPKANTKTKANPKADTKAETKIESVIIADKPPRASRFTPPAFDEVNAYCKERGNGIDAQYFIDYYETRGWMLGKTKMKDWRGAVRTWERNTNGQDNKRDGNNDQEERIAGVAYL